MMQSAFGVRQIYGSRFGRIGLILLLACVLSIKDRAGAESAGEAPGNREQISRTVENLVWAWNRKDPEMLAALFLPDAVLVMPSGKVARSRTVIQQRMLDEWRGKLKETTLTHAVDAVSFQGRDVAVVRGRYRLDGVTILGFETEPEGSFIFRQERQRGRWMIAKAELLRGRAG